LGKREMAAHAIAYWKNPANNTQRKPGYGVRVYLQIRNDGDERGNFYFGVNKNGAECGKHIWNVFLDPNGAKNLDEECSFVMPNSRVTIEYFGGHHDYGTGKWIEDFKDVIYIDPEELEPELCSQEFKVVDRIGEIVAGARVHLTNGKNEYKNTDSLGLVTFTNLQKDRTHYADAEKAGYTKSPVMSFTACKSTRILMLGGSPEPPACDQLVKVANKDTGAGIANVTVAARPTVGTIIRRTTDMWGKCTFNLIEGDDYKLVVETYPEGYECQYTVDCEEDITACETERTFRLKGTAPLPCNQPVKVIDKDTGAGMEAITVAAWQNGARVKDCVTGSDGKCAILSLNRNQMYDIIVETAPVGYGCEYPEDCWYNMQMACDSEITFKLKEEGEPTTLNLKPTKTVITPTEEFCPEVDCPAGIDNVCIYIDDVKTANCANSGLIANIKCKPLYPNDFDKLTGNDLGGIGKHKLQAKTATLASNIVEITVQSDSDVGEIENIECFAKKQFLGGYEITATVTVKNIGTKEYEYKVKMFDPENGKLLDTEPATWLNIEPNETADIELTTEYKTVKCTTPKVKFELWECTSVFPLPCEDHLVDTEEIDCKPSEKPVAFGKVVLYGGIAVGLFATGSIVESVAGPKGKAIGMPVKLVALVPLGLAGYEGYKIVKEKIPWLPLRGGE